MPKSTSAATSILALIFNGTAWADLAENDASSPAASIYIGLHTADPGVGGSQLTNEAAYTNYLRVAVTRNAAGWDVPSAGATANAALVQFAQCGATGATVTHISIGKAPSGAGLVLYAGPLDSPLAVANGIQPQFAAGALDVAEA